tara:strand:- start:203 stop:628 length:426 start_codon:yes stop_codon:yes gene_type:complete
VIGRDRLYQHLSKFYGVNNMKVVKTIKEVGFKVFALKNNVLKLADPVIQTSCVINGKKEFRSLSKNSGRCLEAFKNDGRITIQVVGEKNIDREHSIDMLISHLERARKFGNSHFEITFFDAKNWDNDEPESQPDSEENPVE